jgi:hypothetical protein
MTLASSTASDALEAQAELAAAVQRNAVAAGTMVADLLYTAGQLAG